MIFNKSEILLPKCDDMKKWSVVACDQYTSEPKYWSEVEKAVGNSISTYNLILPEVYLESDDVEDRIKKINDTMKNYLSGGSFYKTEPCCIYVERTLKNGKVRKGIIGAVDLECYNYEKGSKSEIRATEKTVVERIPPRLKVRKNAKIELPHVMLLLDDRKKEIIESLADKKDKFKKVYDFDLMMDSGHLTGYIIDDETQLELDKKLKELENVEKFNEKYGTDESSPLVFAVGDGNHSLATAKAYYLSKKESCPECENIPARYALAELVNLHDDSLEFEAIHRVVFNVDVKKFTDGLKEICSEGAGGQSFTLVTKDGDKTFSFNNPECNIAVGSIQNYIDRYIEENGGTVDYIHGEDVVRNLSYGENVGILLDAMDKNDLFKTVILDGTLPRKTFSMGEACDKRFYTEARIISND